jgi:S-adenosylmethionine:tRNA ribosyltransferase-isomerase
MLAVIIWNHIIANCKMKTQDFYFDLPEHLIAQHPLAERSDSRLLAFNRQKSEFSHHHFKSIADFLEEGDLLVLNDSKVFPARIFGKKSTGGKIEILIERILSNRECLAHIKSSKSPKQGAIIELTPEWQVEILGREDSLFYCRANVELETIFYQIGHIPLPPYITREDGKADTERYQTIYARNVGSVAAPTAGLHFDEAVFELIKQKGVRAGYATLHVGAGTFQPVRCTNIEDHAMHRERFVISQELATLVHETKAAGKRVIAVGTTALRSLESAWGEEGLRPCTGDTNIFIYPGYQFKVCDGLITNFHLPESTLLMLVSAFIGYQQTMELYRIAVENSYRFFSYGDACLLL